MRLYSYISIILLLFTTTLFGISKYEPLYADLIKEKFCWTHFEELSGKDVTCLTEDSTGIFWFGLGSEIHSYDGKLMKQYTRKHGLPPAYVKALVTAPDGRIYSVFESHGVYTLDDTLWHPIVSFKPDSTIMYRDLVPVGPDTFWLATNKGSLFYQNGHCLLYQRDQTYSINPMEHFEANIQSSSNQWDMYSIYIDHYENLWFVDISDRNGTFIKISNWRLNLNDRSKWQRFSASERGISFGGNPKIFQSSDGKYWIYTFTEMTGVYRFCDPAKSWEHIDLTKLGGDNLVLTMIETKDQTVWFGGTGILYAYRDNKFIVYDNDDLDMQIAPISLLQARDGSLWLLSVNIEVNRIDYSRLQWDIYNNLHYQCSASNGDDFFLEVNGRIVTKPFNFLTWYSYGTEDGLMDMPMVVFISQDETLWAAGSMAGKAAISRLNGKRWITDVFPEFSWSIAYQSAMESQDGKLWFGSMSDPSNLYKGGIIVYEKEHDDYVYHHYRSEVESFNRIPVLTQTFDGTIWAGGSQLLQIQQENWRVIAEPKELQKSWIDFALGTSDSSLWAAKGGVGLFRLKNNEWIKYSMSDNLSSNIVTSLLELPNHNILAATPEGISRFNGKSWSKYFLSTDITIPRESGTLRLDSEGQLWINQTTRNWYFRALSFEAQKREHMFRCVKYIGDTLAPNTEITYFQNRLSMPANQYVTWKGSDSWGVTSQNEMTYSYRLDTQEWSNFTSSLSVQLLDIREGDHRFQVRAMDRDGNVDPEPAVVFFEVIPPVWKQAWFWILVAIFSCTIIGLMIGLSLQNQKLSEANSEIAKIASFKERFFLNLSHEVRTPLTMILAPISDLLSSKEQPWNQVKRQLEIMRHNGYYLYRLVNQMLDFRKMEMGKYQLQVAEGSLTNFIKDVSSVFNLFAEEHQINYEIASDPAQLTGWFDHEKLEMILMNLISNAFKFTPDGGKIHIHLTTLQNQHKKQNWIEIRIKDSGIGIPAERLPYIFDRFYYVQHPGQLYYDNIGIGLDLTKEIVELHKGNIKVESQVNQGTTFYVQLPTSREAFKENEIRSKDQKMYVSKLSTEMIESIKEERSHLHVEDNLNDDADEKLEGQSNLSKLLIVEDHSDMREMLAQFFMNDYEVLQAVNGKEAIKIALQHVPDLIISDVMMPEMDGIEFTKCIKTNIITSHIPILLLTVKSEIEHRIEGFETGADAYIAKPFEFAELRVRVLNIIESREVLKRKFSQNVEVDPKEVTVNRLDESFLKKCIEIIEDNISENDFNVDKLCKKLGMSRSQAYIKVKNISGFAINDFIIQIKLKRAAKMLIETTMNISEIAYFLGFSDHSHMNRHFRNTFNCSPKEYRKNHT